MLIAVLASVAANISRVGSSLFKLLQADSAQLLGTTTAGCPSFLHRSDLSSPLVEVGGNGQNRQSAQEGL